MQTAPALDKRSEATETQRGLVANFLGLERNVVAVAVAIFLMAFGENRWKRFVPKYLEALGAPVVAIGLYGITRDFLDGVSQYPGGWIADRFGRRRALTLCVSLAGLSACGEDR